MILIADSMRSTVLMSFIPFSFFIASWSRSASTRERNVVFIIISIVLLLFTPWDVFLSVLADGLSLSLRDSKSPQVSRSLFSILAVLKNVVVRMVFTSPLIYKSSSLFSNPLVTVPNAPIMIGIIVTLLYSLFNSRARWRYFFFFTLFQFYSVVSRGSKVDNFACSLFCCWLS